MRLETCRFAAETFLEFGQVLEVAGVVIGDDRKTGASPFGFGSDEVFGVSMILRISGQLISCSAELFESKQAYAGAALLRQLVELEYLAWAFDNREADAQVWLRSDKSERQKLFRPAKLREAADSRFRGKDYGFHCELGGHPTPTAAILLKGGNQTIQLLMSDMAGHAGGIWGHFVGWAKQHDELEGLFKTLNERAVATATKFQEWQSTDPLVGLPPPE